MALVKGVNSIGFWFPHLGPLFCPNERHVLFGPLPRSNRVLGRFGGLPRRNNGHDFKGPICGVETIGPLQLLGIWGAHTFSRVHHCSPKVKQTARLEAGDVFTCGEGERSPASARIWEWVVQPGALVHHRA